MKILEKINIKKIGVIFAGAVVLFVGLSVCNVAKAVTQEAIDLDLQQIQTYQRLVNSTSELLDSNPTNQETKSDLVNYRALLLKYQNMYAADTKTFNGQSNNAYCSDDHSYSNSSELTPLIQCGATNQHCCDFAEAAIFINRLINWFIYISVSVASITFAVAGGKMLMNPGNEAEWTKAKDMFQKTFIGMLIVLGAWLVVHTVITTLVVNNSGPTGALRFFDSIQQ